MSRTTARPTMIGIALGLLVGLMLTGCSAPDRAGGKAGDTVTTLTFANANSSPDPQLQAFADEVAAKSDNTLTIEFENEWRKGDARFERGTLDDVQNGRVDMGWVGARVFDLVGVNTFDPMLAPMLVDSQALQGKLFADGIPQQMLGGVEKLGVHGIGVLPGPFRRLLSKGAPLDSPSAFAGKTIAIQDSGVAERTFRQLGATTKPIPAAGSLDGVDGVDIQLRFVVANRYQAQGATNVVGNLNLWPRPLVIVIGPRSWAGLSATQQQLLTDAAAEVIPAALQAAKDEDDQGAKAVCASRMTLPQATDDDIAGLTSALRPVYDDIAGADPANRDVLTGIERLKADVGVGPDAATCPETSTSTQAGPGPLDGTWTIHHTGREPAVPDDQVPPNYTKLVIANGRVTMYVVSPSDEEVGDEGTFEVVRDRVEFDDGGMDVTMAWKLDGDTLVLSDMQGDHHPDDEGAWLGRWIRVS